MATVNTITGDQVVNGNITCTGRVSSQTGIQRSSLEMDPSVTFGLPLHDWRVWDNEGTLLPSTVGSADDLGLVTGTFGTNFSYLSTQDLNGAGAITERARIQFTIPFGYELGANFYIAVYAGMLTSAASVSATLDFEAFWQTIGSRAVDGGDIVLDAAKTINSTVLGGYNWLCSGVNGNEARQLDIRMTLAANSVTASAHHAIVARTYLLLPYRS